MIQEATSTRDKRWQKCVPPAVDAFARPGPWPWDDGSPPSADAVYATAWALLAMCEQDGFEPPIDQRVARKALAYLDAAAGPLPEPDSRSPDSRPSKDSAPWAKAAAAMAFTARLELNIIFMDESKRRIDATRRLLPSWLPAWSPEPASNDFQAWFFLTQAAFGEDGWDSWRERVRPMILERQVKDGCARGSWDPLDTFGSVGGRVCSTALSILTLELSYRYPKVFR